MKFGIDINEKKISRELLEALKAEGNYVIDVSIIKNSNLGNRLHKKILLINSSKLDFYLNIEFSKDIYENEFYYKGENSRLFCEEISAKMKKIFKDDSKISEGMDLYLIKNSICNSVLIKINEDLLRERENIVGIIKEALLIVI